MIYLISDPHGGEAPTGLARYRSICKPDDLLIILGDVGLFFPYSEKNKEFNEEFLSLNLNIAFIDGNHENFDYLDSLPEEDWCGGKVHRVTPSIVHLKRGEVFQIHSKTFFVMGGCISSEKWKDINLWYPQENPTEEEINNGYRNLKRLNNHVDYILTHKYEKFDPNASALTLQGLTNFIDSHVTFNHWYAGHWHKNLMLDERHTTVYDIPTPIPNS